MSLGERFFPDTKTTRFSNTMRDRVQPNVATRVYWRNLWSEGAGLNWTNPSSQHPMRRAFSYRVLGTMGFLADNIMNCWEKRPTIDGWLSVGRLVSGLHGLIASTALVLYAAPRERRFNYSLLFALIEPIRTLPRRQRDLQSFSTDVSIENATGMCRDTSSYYIYNLLYM